MIELLKKQNYDILKFQPFIDYIAFLETQGYEFVSEKEEYDWVEYLAKGKNHELKILSMKDKKKEWVTIYKTKNENERFEQVEFMFFNENYMKICGEQDYNYIVQYAAHFEDDEFTRMVCSAYKYKNNNLLNGWRELRKFDVQDLNEVMYSKMMNLTELILWADKKIFEFYEVITLKGEEVKELKLEY